MNFYSLLSQFYEEIFPHSRDSLDFIAARVMPGQSLLDAGCGTGGIVRDLRKKGIQARGFDLDESMIHEARNHLSNETGTESESVYQSGNLTEMKEMYDQKTFDCLTCLGNTLIHIPFNLQFQFLQDSAGLLNSGGTLILQILNYNNILEEGMEFPLIDTPGCQFRRRYEPGPAEGMLYFQTELKEKKTGKVFDNSIIHYPLMPETLMAALSMSGYAEWDTFGSYRRGALQDLGNCR